jgi:hypothetical protein
MVVNFPMSKRLVFSANNGAGTIYYSINHGEILKYVSPFKIKDDVQIEAYAENRIGRGESVVANFKKVQRLPYEEITSTLAEHAQSGRITWKEYPAFLAKYGPLAKVTLYKLAGSEIWTDIRP